MRHTTVDELTLAEVMGKWPSTVRLFIDMRLHCVGCPIAPFHTLLDAANEHGIAAGELLAAVRAEVAKPAR